MTGFCGSDGGAAGDGTTDDTTTLQTQLDTGVLFLNPTKTYLITSALTPPAGALIFGGGTLLRSDNGTTGTQNRPVFIDINAVDDVTVLDITFSHTGTGEMVGIYVLDADDTQIRDCRFINGCNGVFVFRLSNRTSIHGCVFDDCELFGCASGGDTTGNVSGLVYDLSIMGCKFNSIPDEGIDINWHTQRFIISGNHFINCGTNANSGAVEVGAITDVCKDGVISGNFFDGGGSSDRAIQLKNDTTNVSIAGNTMINYDTGANLIGVISIGASGTLCTHISITGNTIQGGYCGIHLNNCQYVSVSGGSIEGCAEYGIEMEAAAPDCSITGANITAIGKYGVVLRGNRQMASNNIVTNCGRDGIIQTAGDDPVVVGNIFANNSTETSNTYHGATFSSGVDSGVFLGNRVTGSAQIGATFATSADWIVVGNQCLGNNSGNLTTGSLTSSQIANNEA